ncbi:hypothetical protein LTDYDHKI_CDS0002 [Exiguobacterium phage phiExGM16]
MFGFVNNRSRLAGSQSWESESGWPAVAAALTRTRQTPTAAGR